MLADAFLMSFDASTRARGADYARSGKVLGVSGNGPLHFIARVRGTYTYDVVVELLGEDYEEGFDIEGVNGTCTCPMRFNCKHVAAALTVWAAKNRQSLTRAAAVRPPPAPAAAPPAELFPGLTAVRSRPWRGGDPEVQRWLAELAGRHAADEAADGQWLIFAATVTDDGLRILPVLCRRLKSGKRSAGRRFASTTAFLNRPPECATAEDERLVALLDSVAQGRAARHDWRRRSREPFPAAVLEQALATSRLHWGDDLGAPLARHPELTARPRWRSNGRLRRVALADDQDHDLELLPVDPPWVRVAGGLAPLASGLPQDLLRSLIGMPWMDQAEARICAAALAGAAPELAAPELPPPPPARPHLRIARVRLGWYARGQQREREADVAVVTFRYGDEEVVCGGEPIVDGADGAPILRHLASERERSAELQRFGLAVWPPHGIVALPLRGAGTTLLWTRCADLVGPGDEAVTLPPALLAALQGSGWEISGADVAAITEVDLGGVTAQVEERAGGDWFELHLGMDVGGQRLDLVPLLTPLLAGGPEAWERLPRGGGDQPVILVAAGALTVLRVPLALLKELHDHLVELFDGPPGPGGGWRVDAARADIIGVLDQLSPRWLGERKLRGLADRLRSCLSPPAVRAPDGLGLTLRPYQLDGLAWLQHLRGLGLGGILADDMGLGKTAQAIAHLLAEHRAERDDRASLVVCPASMVGPWRTELARAAPDLRVAVLHGVGRAAVDGVQADVVVTTHATLARDEESFAARPWHVAICDEAQAMKNPTSRLAATVRRLDTRQRVCLTGTPVENHLGELHTLLSWVAPGALGSARAFARTFRAPIEEQDDLARRALLRRRVAPFLLRRTKEAVARELPARTEIDVTVELPPAQRRLYDALRLAMDERVRAVIAERGLKRSGLQILEALLRLRQACCDPRLLPGKLAARCKDTAKLSALGELLGTLLDEGRRVLVFSQFTALLDLVELDVLAPRGVACLRLDGQTRGRDRLVERFQGGECPVFLLSLKAGGTGLTLTAADSVVLLDPWWNPAVERQAADRVHRIGQTRPVTIYRLIAAGTVEERIRQLQARKAALADALVDEDGQALGKLDLADIEALLAPLGEDGVGMMGG